MGVNNDGNWFPFWSKVSTMKNDHLTVANCTDQQGRILSFCESHWLILESSTTPFNKNLNSLSFKFLYPHWDIIQVGVGLFLLIPWKWLFHHCRIGQFYLLFTSSRTELNTDVAVTQITLSVQFSNLIFTMHHSSSRQATLLAAFV